MLWNVMPVVIHILSFYTCRPAPGGVNHCPLAQRYQVMDLRSHNQYKARTGIRFFGHKSQISWLKFSLIFFFLSYFFPLLAPLKLLVVLSGKQTFVSVCSVLLLRWMELGIENQIK